MGHYENFEFLGDAVLSLAAAEALVRKAPGEDEGLLSQKRAQYVSKDFLSEAAKRLELSQLIRVGNDVKADEIGLLPDSILADVIESIIGATYLDAGLEAAKKVISSVLGDLPTEVRQNSQDAKTVLQERFQASCTLTPAYEVLECVGHPMRPLCGGSARGRTAVGSGPGALQRKRSKRRPLERWKSLRPCPRRNSAKNLQGSPRGKKQPQRTTEAVGASIWL